MRIERLTIPTPFIVGPINIYLIIDDPLTLVDTGPKTDEARAALQTQLAALGYRWDHIRRIILTHTHEDHCGLAGMIQKVSGATVYVHEWELAEIGPNRHGRVNRALLARAGVPDERMEQMTRHYDEVKSYADPVDDVVAYRDADEFTFASGALRVVHTPGHTPGSCCLLRESNRLMLTGDTILKNITPNPILNADPLDPARRFPSLGEYLVSLARIRDIAPTLMKTAHGDDVTDYEEHFYRLVKHVNERQAKLITLLPREGVSAYQMSQLLFPRVKEINQFLAASETIAHLDQAVADGKLRMETRDGVDYWFR
ncbi:MAG: MBL fold metallo-hydrolase [Blastocatellia bacterium]